MEATTIRQLAYVADGFHKLDPEMPMQQAAAFLVIAQKEGLTVTEVAKRTGQNTASITRTLQALSQRPAKPGLDVICPRPDPMDARRKTAHLPRKGHALATRLSAHLSH
jgi:DNA-binding MarR family transcriptional regulator